MKAIMCTAVGDSPDLALLEAEQPQLTTGEARIAVRTAGLNFADLLMTRGAYQHRPEVPFIPGFEAAGILMELVDSNDRVRVGDRVIALTYGGAFAEQIVVPASRVMPIPANMPWDVAGKFGGAYCTAWIALKRRSNINPGECLLVLGATSSVGLAAVDLGQAIGAKVIAVARTAEAAVLLEERGASVIVTEDPQNLRDLVFSRTGDGVDVVFDPLGGAWFDAALRCCMWGGRMLVVGFAAGDIQQIPANLLLVKSLSAVGVLCNSHVEREPGVVHQAMADLAILWAGGKLDPLICETFAAEEIEEAMTALVTRQHPGGICISF